MENKELLEELRGQIVAVAPSQVVKAIDARAALDDHSTATQYAASLGALRALLDWLAGGDVVKLGMMLDDTLEEAAAQVEGLTTLLFAWRQLHEVQRAIEGKGWDDLTDADKRAMEAGARRAAQDALYSRGS